MTDFANGVFSVISFFLIQVFILVWPIPHCLWWKLFAQAGQSLANFIKLNDIFYFVGSEL
jgi:hypothetical protein